MRRAELSVPGRLCITGEHSDWAGIHRVVDPFVRPGICIVACTEQTITAEACARPGELRVVQERPRGEPEGSVVYTMEEGALLAAARSGAYDSYIAGAACAFLREHDAGGMDLRITGRSLPVGRGLSSSAAVCVITVRALGELEGLDLGVREEMELAYRGELLTGSRCGRMDQVCAMGTAVSVMTFSGGDVDVRPIEVGCDLHFLVVDLGQTKDTRRILAALQSAFGSGDTGIRAALGERNEATAALVEEAITLGDAETLGMAMTAAQESFDRLVAPLCKEELAAPLLHRVLDHPATGRLTLGGKGVGSQGDGAAQLLCPTTEAAAELASILHRDLSLDSIQFNLGVGARG